MDKASTETWAFFRYPAKRINAMKYQTSKLQIEDLERDSSNKASVIRMIRIHTLKVINAVNPGPQNEYFT
jgi:hypothetical protein